MGLATSEGQLVSPAGVFFNTKNAVLKLAEFCQRERVEKIVIGIAEGKVAQKQKEFGEKIAKACGLPVEFWDETLTSREAVQKMIEIGKKRKSRRLEDAISAALILQSYLDSQKVV